MLKNKKILVIVVVLVLGISSLLIYEKINDYKQSQTRENFYTETEKLVVSKGYSIDEIKNLRDFQIVDKVYDNEVLERFNKIQGYIYDGYSLLPNGMTLNSGELQTNIINEEECRKRNELENKYLSNGEVEYHVVKKKYIILPAKITRGKGSDDRFADNRVLKEYAQVNFHESDIENNTNIELEKFINIRFNESGGGSGNYFTSLDMFNNNIDLDFKLNIENYQKIKKEEIDTYLQLGVLKESKQIENGYNAADQFYEFVVE